MKAPYPQSREDMGLLCTTIFWEEKCHNDCKKACHPRISDSVYVCYYWEL